MDRYAAADANNANVAIDAPNYLYSDYRNDHSNYRNDYSDRFAYDQGRSYAAVTPGDRYYSNAEYQAAAYLPYNERQVITVPPNLPYDQYGQPPIIIVERDEHRHHGGEIARGVGSFVLAALSSVNIGINGRHGGFHFGNGYYGGWNHGYGGYGGGYYNPGYGGGYYNGGCGGGYYNSGYGGGYYNGGYYNGGYGGGYYNGGYGGAYCNPGYGGYNHGYGGGYYNGGYGGYRGGYGAGMINMMINSFGHHHNNGGWGHYMNYGFGHHRRDC